MNLHERLEGIFAAVLGHPDLQLTDQTTAADVEGWDSVAHINLMFAIEESFGIMFDDDEFARFTDVGNLKAAIARKIGDAA